MVVVVVRGGMGRSRCVTRVMFQPRLLDLATRGRLLLINYNCIILLIKITDKIKIHYKPTRIPFRTIPGVIPFRLFLWPFQRNLNSGLNSAGTEITI